MFGGFGDDNPFGVNFGFTSNYPQRFDEHYRVYPVSFCDKGHLEDGDKILLPPSALETLARLHIEYPMLFKVTNEGAERHSHCGVLEFSAPEGTCYMPYWMMQNLFISEGEIVNIQNISLPKATFVKIRPQSQEFLELTNPRAVLEASLRKFSCVTIGDTICLHYNNKKYFLDVREVKPAPAACIIETDCEVDFEAPADYTPPQPPSTTTQPDTSIDNNLPYGGVPTMTAKDMGSAKAAPSTAGSAKKLGGGLRLNRRPAAANTGGRSLSGVPDPKASTDPATLRAARLKKYEAFHGTGQSLSGKISTEEKVSIGRTLGSGSANQQDSKDGMDSKDSSRSSEAKSKSTTPFQGEGRRLR